MLKVLKKTGRTEEFDKTKIELTVELAAKSIGRPDSHAKKLGDTISVIIESSFGDVNGAVELETSFIHESVESLLMKLDDETARAYIQYRQRQEILREGLTNITANVEKVLNKDSRVVNENANKDSNKYSVTRDLTTGSVAKAMALKNMLPKRVANAHIKGDIHIHDLDFFPFQPMNNCCLIDFESMFSEGTRIGNAKIETPKSIGTAAALTAQIVANVSSSQYGGASFDRMDEVLAPYAKMNYIKNLNDYTNLAIELALDGFLSPEQVEAVEERAKEKTKKEIYDAIQGLEYEINTLYSSSGQTPFFTVGFGQGTSWYAREIQRAILENRMAGLGGRIAIFPKLVFTLKRGVNLESTDPNYDLKKLALKCTSECIYPDILNYEKISEITGNFKVPMGCRSFLHAWKDKEGNEVNSSRFNIGVTTINLPRIAIQAKGSKKRFWRILDSRLDVAKESMEFRIKRIKDAKPVNAPILYMDGAFGRLEADGCVWDLMKDKRASISLGYIGLYEVGALFHGTDWQEDEEAKEFTLDVIKYLDKAAKSWADEFDVGSSVYGTPSESLTDRFCQLDTEKFGIIKDVTDKEYYTNSFHYDTRKQITPFEKIDFEKDYVPYSPGGAISYVELANARQNLKALEDIWDYSYDRIGYFGVNTPVDKCFECGFIGDFNSTERGYECPSCGNTNPETADVVKRLCGYLGNPLARPEVHGRHKEIGSRVKHDA